MTIWLLISALLNSMQSMMEVVLSVTVGMTGVLCHMDWSTDDTDMMLVGCSGMICHPYSLTALYCIIYIVATL